MRWGLLNDSLCLTIILRKKMMKPLRMLLACTLLAPSIHSSSYADKIQSSIYGGLSIDKIALVNTYRACQEMRDDKSQSYNPHGVRTCFEEPAKNGFIPAQYELGMLFEMGEGGEKNLYSARYWHLMAAKQQDYTRENIGALDKWVAYLTSYPSYHVLENSDGPLAMDEDVKKALDVLETMTLSEDIYHLDIYYQKHMDIAKTRAQFRFGRMLALGEGGDKDLYAARAWLAVASQKGYEPLAKKVLWEVEQMISKYENQL
jgi:TPR repeat protein